MALDERDLRGAHDAGPLHGGLEIRRRAERLDLLKGRRLEVDDDGARLVCAPVEGVADDAGLPPSRRRADRFPEFVNGIVRSDGLGVANIFVEAGQPGVWRVRETSAGWLREDVQMNATDYADVADARVIDDAHALTAINTGEGVWLFDRDATGWHPLGTNLFASVFEVFEFSTGMSLDPADQPWVASVTYHSTGVDGSAPPEFLDLVGPDRTLQTISSLMGDVPEKPRRCWRAG